MFGGHELTHAVVEHSSNLFYADQSGALNESFADIFGTMIERENWVMGEKLFNDGDVLRSLKNPQVKGKPCSHEGFLVHHVWTVGASTSIAGFLTEHITCLLRGFLLRAWAIVSASIKG